MKTENYEVTISPAPYGYWQVWVNGSLVDGAICIDGSPPCYAPELFSKETKAIKFVKENMATPEMFENYQKKQREKYSKGFEKYKEVQNRKPFRII